MTTLRFNLPTILTLSRIVLIPFFVLSVYQHPILGALIFSIASITDFLDGYLARRSGQITTFGIIMDPLADKFLVISALIVLVDMERLSCIYRHYINSAGISCDRTEGRGSFKGYRDTCGDGRKTQDNGPDNLHTLPDSGRHYF